MTLTESDIGGALDARVNSLEVSKEAASIVSVRRLLGIPIRQDEMHLSQFVRFDKKSTMKTQSGGKHTIYYSVYGVDHQGNKILLGEGFKGEGETRAAIRILARELGLPETADRPPPGETRGLAQTASFS